jgi:hypothetical protein
MKVSRWRKAAVVSAVAFAGLSAAHLTDDFAANVPQEFNLSPALAEILALVYMTALVGLVAFAAKGSRHAYIGLIAAGLIIALAQILKSVPEILAPGPWHLGVVSESLALGLLVAAVAAAITSLLALRAESRRPTSPD